MLPLAGDTPNGGVADNPGTGATVRLTSSREPRLALETVRDRKTESSIVTTTDGSVAGVTTMCGGSTAEPVSGRVTVGVEASLLWIESVAVDVPSTCRWYSTRTVLCWVGSNVKAVAPDTTNSGESI